MSIKVEYVCCKRAHHLKSGGDEGRGGEVIPCKVRQKNSVLKPTISDFNQIGPNISVYKIWQIPIDSEVMVIWNLVQFTLFAPAAAILDFKAG